MSLFGALDAAVGGMNAQSTALGSISDNIANSQTVGFKATDTSFDNYVTEASETIHTPGAVIARPQYTNSNQGTIASVSSPTSLAIAGGGFFSVQSPTGASSFSTQPYYTRTGDFAPNSAGYLVNSAGYALNGWPATNAAGTQFDPNAAAPIKISKAPSPPMPTTVATLGANLPATPPAGTSSYSSSTQIYDAAGNAQKLTTTWSQATAGGGPVSATNPAIPNQWDLTVTGGNTTTGPMLVSFGNNPNDAGTITAIAAPPGSSTATVAAIPATQSTGSTATLNLGLNFGLGTQNVALNLGQFGSPKGVTQFSGSTYSVASQTQDGAAQGNYSSVTIKPTGDVVIGYDNGATATVARIPLVNFSNPDALQQQNGQAFTATTDSGNPNIAAAGTAGNGALVVGAVEGSNVDIATQFTRMIVAQQAYTANSKVISTTNQMMQVTMNMIQG